MSLPKAAYWKEAADKEIQSMEKHGVYELVPMFFVPSSQNVVGTRWVNKIKADGTFKSRLVVAGMVSSPRYRLWGYFRSNMMVELGFEKRFNSVPLYLDNTSTLHVAGNRTYSPW